MCEELASRSHVRSRASTAPSTDEGPVSIRARAGRRRLRTSPSGAPISGCNELLCPRGSAWLTARPAWRLASCAWMNAVIDSNLHGLVVLCGAMGSYHELWLRCRRRHGSQQLLSRSCLLTRPCAHHAFLQGYFAQCRAHAKRVSGGKARMCALSVIV